VKKTIKDTMADSVAAHMIADVPVGSFLSGGIDSGIIATFASQNIKSEVTGPLSTFTIGFQESNEWDQARELSDAIHSDHQQIVLEWKDYFAALPTIAWHFDEPVADPSAIALYFLAREARKKVKVVLSGEGADELFGGYNIYLEPYARRKLQYIPRAIRRSLHSVITALKLSDRFPKLRGVKFLERSLLTPEEWYIGNATIFTKKEIQTLWTAAPLPSFDVRHYYKKVGQYSDSVKMQYIDINTWLKGDILAKADKMSMANSLEVRVPFLDKEVAAVAATLTDDMKWHDNETKSLLRASIKEVIPESTRLRKKLGFPTPIHSMITAHYQDIETLIMHNPYLKDHCSMDYIQQLLSDHQNVKSPAARKIFALLMFSIWYEQYFIALPRLD
jgi:asparagine synthase (glutamine-hydrolysing)